MSTLALTHSPARVLRDLMISMGLVTLPSSNGLWPASYGLELVSPDNVVTIYNVEGQSDGRSMPTLELFQHYGIQIRVRSTTHDPGFLKADAIRNSIAQNINKDTVTIEGTTYLVDCLSKIGPVLSLGKNTPMSKHDLFTINALMSMVQLP